MDESTTAGNAEDSRLTLKIAAAAAAGFALAGVAAAITDSATASAWAPVARAAMVALPVAVGAYAWQRQPIERFGALLVATGFGWFLTTLAESNDELVYSIGRVAGWLVEVGLVYLVLSFPTGRLSERIDRALVAASAALVATLYLPTALIAESYPVPAPFTSCTSGCPENAFFALGSQPEVLDAVVRPLREVLTILLFLAVTGRLAARVRHATPLMRRALSPVLVAAALRLLVLVAVIVARRVDPETASVEVLSWIAALGLPVMVAGFFLGLVRRRLLVGDALPRLGARLHANLGPEELRAALADALQDPSLRLAYWVPLNGGRWVDAGGRPMQLSPWEAGRCVTEVRDRDRRIAAIVHDAALNDDKQLIEGAAAYARIALENQRLSAKVESSLREIAESRGRIMAAADEERRRIERDLHDGAQQRLVALRIKLELTEELLERDRARGLVKLHSLGGELEETLEEIRSLSRGVYPSLLADAGLAEALRAVALRAPIPALVNPDGVGRYSREVESAVYFCCLEAIQNASKHATDATAITISLADAGGLRFEVRDDGVGFDVEGSRDGAGLTNMRDRLAALGGDLTIRSTAGEGVVVSGSLPRR